MNCPNSSVWNACASDASHAESRSPWYLLRIVTLAAFLILFLPVSILAQDSPHGDKLKTPCETCHTPSSWKDISRLSKFDHTKTSFPLKGQHSQVQCKLCHRTLVFDTVPALCNDCHKDVHSAELGAACDRCHSPQSWLIPDMAQRHASTRFPLMGPHAALPCQSCHTNQQKQEYVNIAVDCVGCHRTNYDATTNPPHSKSGFGTDCQGCHAVTSATWNIANISGGGTFNHDVFFPLTGGHASIPCASCHANNQFASAPTTCYGCHTDQATNRTTPVPHTTFPTDCKTCHDTQVWTDVTTANVPHNPPLTGAHMAVATCDNCHKGNYTVTSQVCSDCHTTSLTPRSTPVDHTGFSSTDCSSCHNTTAWQPRSPTFNHSSMTNFPLTGGHLALTCNQCHTTAQYAATPVVCYSCHTDAVTNRTAPVPHTTFPTACQTCHDTQVWTDVTTVSVPHNPPLTGAHLAIGTCDNCHKSNYTATSQICSDCHTTSLTSRSTPVDHTGFISTDCSSCHNTSVWTPHTAQFNHSTMTNYPLTGAHLALTCNQCHTTAQYAATPVACYSCHTDAVTNRTTPVPHTTFPTTCQTCHDTQVWNDVTTASVPHNPPLTGAHLNIQTCDNCHNGNYTITSQICSNCHTTSLTPRATPVDHTGFISPDCSSCHNTTAWQPRSSTFNHSTMTNYPLTGAHATAVNCIQCHTTPQYAATPLVCSTCHTTGLTPRSTPVDHVGIASTDCASCHNTTAWQPSTFNHTTMTSFPLTGGHAAVANQCASCHTTPTFASTPTQCYACHRSNFTTAVTPVRHSPGLSTNCTQCHNSTAWQPSTFNHASTGFQLTGAHATPVATCNSCHIGGVYAGTQMLCASCHNTPAPPAVSHVGFPSDCSECHNTSTFLGATNFNHNPPLTGAHLSISSCDNCHHGNFTTTSQVCSDCHTTTLTPRSTPVDHAGFMSTDCSSCHNTTAWNPLGTQFNHTTKTSYPLTGGHLAVACIQCHTTAQYAATPVVCSSCHTDAVTNRTTPVPHTTFPTTCQTCHDTNIWTDVTTASVPHNPPLTGAHLTVSTCDNCHNGNYTTTSQACYSCHASTMATATTPVPHLNFPQDCSTCHTTNVGWAPSTFVHTRSMFPQDSRHTAPVNANQCNKCHQTPTDYSQYCCTSSGCHNNCQGGD